MHSMSDYMDQPGWWKREREAMLVEARRRRMLLATISLVVIAMALGGHYVPCPGGIGQY
jgi:hypothetical protein